MGYPNQSAQVPSITSVLKKISDDKTLVLFNSIAVSSETDRYIPIKQMNLSTKQYYSRISGLTDAGLVKKRKGKYFLTLLGKVVYEAQMIIGKTLSYSWKLKVIESIEVSTSEERTQLIDALIDNHQIKDIFMKSISNPSIESNSRIQTQTAVVD
jgi:hypothetical protein